LKLNHKVNFGHGPNAEEITPEYQREIDATLRRAEKAWRKAQQAAERAVRLAEKRPEPETRARREEAIALVTARLAELEEIRRLMSTPTYRQPEVVHRAGKEERLETGVLRRGKGKRTRKSAVTTRRK
jgi:vacuolar-type H+-ATPase subunit E/Vma4